MKKILVLHGPNLNRLSMREPDIYGHTSLIDLDNALQTKAALSGIELTCLQSNDEAVLINAIHQAEDDSTDFIIINPAAFTHTSVAMRDALLATDIPFFEVHISNVFAREPFRHHSFFSDIAQGVICGFGTNGYLLALQAIIENNHDFLS